MVLGKEPSRCVGHHSWVHWLAVIASSFNQCISEDTVQTAGAPKRRMWDRWAHNTAGCQTRARSSGHQQDLSLSFSKGEEGHKVRELLPPEFILFCAQKKYNFNFSLHQGPTLPLVDQVGLGVNDRRGAFYMEAMDGGDAWISQEAQDSQALLPQHR